MSKFSKFLRSKMLYVFLVVGTLLTAAYFIRKIPAGTFEALEAIKWYLVSGCVLFLALLLIYLYRKKKVTKFDDEKKLSERAENPSVRYYEEFYALITSTWNKVGINSERLIYAKPWYLCLGSSGAGKSSVIRQSDIVFERSEEVTFINKKISDLSGPVQFSLSKEAIIVEVAEQGSDDDWSSFLEWLRFKRKTKPLNGLVLSIDIESLINSPVGDRKSLAKKVIDEIRRLNDFLGVRLPVYIVITKIDLLEGFTEFYANDSVENYEDLLLGLTFPLAIDSKKGLDTDWVTEFSQQYDLLIEHLNKSLYERMINEEISQELYVFVRQMIGFKAVLYSLLAEIFKESAHSTYPLLRSIFFTSSEQQSLPFNAVTESASKFFDIPSVIYQQRQGYSKSLFVKNIFPKKILPESGLVGDSFYVQKSQFKSHVAQYIFCGLLVIVASSAWSFYYQSNKQSAANVLAGLAELDSDSSTQTPEGYLNSLNILRTALDEYDHDGGKSAVSDMGLYKGGLITPSVKNTYHKLLSEGFFKSLITEMLSQNIQATEKDSLDKFKIMRVVRLMSEPTHQEGLDEGQKQDLTKYKQSIVIPWLRQRWQEKLTGQSDEQEQLMKHLTYGLENVGVELDPSQQTRLKRLQVNLARISLPQRLYNQLRIESDYELGQGVSLSHEIGGSFDESFNVRGQKADFTIPMFFTYRGFHEFYVSRYDKLMSMAELDTWAMGRADNPKSFSSADIKRFQGRINDIYLDDYKKAWLNAINSIELIGFDNDLGRAVKKLNSMAISDKPYRSLLKAVQRDTVLVAEVPSLAIEANKESAKEVDSLGLKDAILPNQLKLDIAIPLKKDFHIYNDLLEIPDGRDSAYIDDIEAVLAKLHTYMVDLQQNRMFGDEKGYALKKVMQRIELKSDDDPFYLLSRLASGLAEPMQSQLKQISSESWKIVLNAASKDLNDLWKADVYDAYLQKIQGRYPFSTNAQNEVSPDDFKAFFATDGIAATFHEKYLLPILTQGGTGNDSSMLVNSNVLQFFEHVKAIREGLFTNKGEYGVSFSIEPTDLSSAYLNSVLNIDGVSISYQHARTPVKDMVWPNQLGAGGRSFIRVTSRNRTTNAQLRQADGSWSLLRLLDASKTIALGRKTREISFPFSAGSSSYKIKVMNEINPITQDLFSDFRVPRSISNTKLSKESANLL